MTYLIVRNVVLWLMSITVCCLAEPELYWSNKTIPILGKVGKPSRSGLQAATLDSNYSVPALGASVFNTGGAIGPGTLEGRGLDVLDTRQTCPPTHPVPCAGGLCCQATFPVCCIAQNGGCCPSNKPVCVTNGCCPSGTTLCPNDPNTCKTATQTCCGLGKVCPITHTCCGLGACCPIGDTEAGKCCQASNPLESMCAGQYDVCCDGWTCPEGSTCSADRGYCNVPVLTFGYQGPNSLTIDLIRNTCLGFRSEMARGRPNVAANYQLLTYYGPNSPNRQQTDCRSSRQCCTGQLVPAGKPGAGDPTECDEYPPNSAIEGGAGAHVACVNKYANQAGGELIGAMVSGRHRGFKYWLEVVGLDCNTVQSSDVEPCNP